MSRDLGSLAQAILEETEYPGSSAPAAPPKNPSPEKIARAKFIMGEAIETRGRPALAFSGGGDSLVLLDIAAEAGLAKRMIVTWVDTGMEYPESPGYIKGETAARGFELRIARASRKPIEQWTRTGWPMLGKQAARLWTQQNAGAGFKINVSECCRAMKINPGRTLTKNLGCQVQLTGQRGQVDDNLRGLRDIKDGILFFQGRDQIWICNPLTGWTDAEIRGYIAERHLEEHPAKARGAKTIGCIFCGGGSQYTNSGYRVLRKTWPEAWHEFMVTWGGGMIVLALKYARPLRDIREAIGEIGGLDHLAKTRPWLFDFTRKTPLKGYDR